MANSRHKRDTNARRIAPAARIAAPIAVFVTLGAVGAGVLGASPEVREIVSANQASATSAGVADREDEFLSRSFSRGTAEARALSERLERQAERRATRKAIRNADAKLWTTADLNLWTDATRKAEKLGLLDDGKKVLVTGRRDNGRAEIVLDGRARWVTAAYLSADKPEPPEPAEAAARAGTGGACTNGTSVPDGVSPNIEKVHQAVCAAFPEITTYGTFRGGGGDHPKGLAVDIMVSGDRGWQVAEFIRANAGAFGINYAIYSQQIWSVERGGEGWRGMEDRGSVTANHYDHVHVTTY